MKTYIRQIVCEVRRSVKLAKDLYWRYLAETSDIARSATRVHRPVCRAPHILASWGQGVMSIVKERPTWSVAAAPTFLFSQLQSRDSLVGIVTRLQERYLFLCFFLADFNLLPTHRRCRGLSHSIKHASTLGRTPLDEWSVRRRDLYLNTTLTRDGRPCFRRDSNPNSKRAAADPRLRPRGHFFCIIIFSRMSWLSLGPTQLPVQWIPALFGGGKADSARCWPLISIYSEVKNECSCTSIPHIRLHSVERDKLTFLPFIFQ